MTKWNNVLAFTKKELRELRFALRETNVDLDEDLRRAINADWVAVLLVFADGHFNCRTDLTVDTNHNEPEDAEQKIPHRNYKNLIKVVDSKHFKEQTRKKVSDSLEIKIREAAKISNESEGLSMLIQTGIHFSKMSENDLIRFQDFLTHHFSPGSIQNSDDKCLEEHFEKGLCNEQALIEINLHSELPKVYEYEISIPSLTSFFEKLFDKDYNSRWVRYKGINDENVFVTEELNGIKLAVGLKQSHLERFTIKDVINQFAESNCRVWFNSPRRNVFTELVAKPDSVDNQLSQLLFEYSPSDYCLTRMTCLQIEDHNLAELFNETN